jgi:putative transposase
MIVTRTEQIQFKSDTVSELAHASKNLYNAANYLIRQEFIKNRKWINYYELNNILKEYPEYKSLPAQTSQQILKLLDKNWKSFFKSIKDWTKNPSKYKGRPKLPKYKAKDGVNILIFTNQQCKIKDGILKFPKVVNLELKTRLQDVKLNQVRIIPNQFNYVCEIVYEKEVSPEELDSERVIGIDLGVNNIVTIGNNFGSKPIVVKGGIVKNINQFYNKEKARVQSIYDIQKIKYGNKLAKLDHVRNNKIKDYFHKLSRFVVNYASEHKVKTIIIGNNTGWKQDVNMGKKNNQTFVSIPFAKLIQMIQYKSEELGIDVIVNEESYTSKCSFLDNESICKHEEYAGKRIKRGLFRSSNGTLINADLNGAYNIIRKVIPEAFKGIEDVGLHPNRHKLMSFKQSERSNELEMRTRDKSVGFLC